MIMRSRLYILNINILNILNINILISFYPLFSFSFHDIHPYKYLFPQAKDNTVGTIESSLNVYTVKDLFER